MSQESLDSTEIKIKEAARELFSELGMKGATMRKVAEKAEVNVALVNYYFRSKEKLFLSIFEEKFRSYTKDGLSILNDTSRDLLDRIKTYIDRLNHQINNDQGLPIFILSETHYNPNLLDMLSDLNKEQAAIETQQLQATLDLDYHSGKIRPIKAIDFQMALFSMIVFPIISKKILTKTGKLAAAGFESYESYEPHWKNTTLSIMEAFLKPLS
ncbi:transcriptional regulator, TetR family [Reichenbachiella agariperforans]|uniref:Transcriptional regulator, TetR family n=1 Tax=Reichenbachiella agariperforans TaxID=156994 RepID=A0A1M6P023_REIAG|nr:TetR/AcrR family transcriptional regulator [Reichenbachiella agariperforans]SHK01327.1 transcriptional regulator, TetR family [Reichenbachiella agariperforans]